MTTKTNAVRFLDTHKTPYQLKSYEISTDDLSAQHVAEVVGIPIERMYKTLVLKGSTDPYLVAVIPGNTQLDLKKLAKISGNKHCEMLPMKDLLTVTGYIRGGCSPIAMKKQFPTFIDELVTLEEEIAISAGKRGLQIIMNPVQLIDLLNIKIADISFIA